MGEPAELTIGERVGVLTTSKTIIENTRKDEAGPLETLAATGEDASWYVLAMAQEIVRLRGENDAYRKRADMDGEMIKRLRDRNEPLWRVYDAANARIDQAARIVDSVRREGAMSAMSDLVQAVRAIDVMERRRDV